MDFLVQNLTQQHLCCRVFQGILFSSKESILDGGLHVKEGKIDHFLSHKCEWVFCIKLATAKDKESYEGFINEIDGQSAFGPHD